MDEEPPSANSFIFAYLKSISAKLAKQFKSEVGKASIKDLPAGSPTIPEMVKHYREETPVKRKLDDSLNGTPAKKAKTNGAKPAEKESSSSEEDSSDEEEEPAKKPPPVKEAPGKSNIYLLIQPWLCGFTNFF